MKKVTLLFQLLFLMIPFLFTQEQVSPVAAITEINGKLEIRKGNTWEEVLPLQPLYPGDVLRVNKGGKAVLLYLGFSSETITDSNSPYTVQETKVGKSKSQKIIDKFKSVILDITQKKEEKTAALFVRDITSSIKILKPPKNTLILFPKPFLLFEWEASKPPYSVGIYLESRIGEREKVFEKKLDTTRLEVPGDIFQEGKIFYWVVFTEQEEESGYLQFLDSRESSAVQSELKELLGTIPEENQITRIVVTYGFFVDKGLYYDAHLVREKAQAQFPENETIKKLQNLD